MGKKRVRKKREKREEIRLFGITGRLRRGHVYVVVAGKLRRRFIEQGGVRMEISDEAHEALAFLRDSLL